ncbi:MAG: tRNA (adenosine(37)-N6)-dimethylallyltransferase MiaA [Coriobacteriia bacterium]
MQRARAPIAIVGPTAVGKTAAGEVIAASIGGEIVSADSMQVYRGMDIGTAKTSAEDRKVAHHCIDLVVPGEPYSAALFQRDARDSIAEILARGLTPVVVGGTGLYVRAALDQFDFPQGDVSGDIRARIERRARVIGPEALHAELAEVDPDAARLIHPNNVRRTVRALEMLSAGRRYSDQASGFRARVDHYPGTVFLGLMMERAALYDRVDRRVDAMVPAGLLGEVERLVAAGYREALTSMQAISYKELLPVLDRTVSLDEAVEDIKRATRRYAKRQLTWFRADPRIRWIDVTCQSPDQAAEAALHLLESSPHSR